MPCSSRPMMFLAEKMGLNRYLSGGSSDGRGMAEAAKSVRSGVRDTADYAAETASNVAEGVKQGAAAARDCAPPVLTTLGAQRPVASIDRKEKDGPFLRAPSDRVQNGGAHWPRALAETSPSVDQRLIDERVDHLPVLPADAAGRLRHPHDDQFLARIDPPVRPACARP